MKSSLAKQFPLLAKAGAWFYGQSHRDQLALTWMAVAVALFLVFILVWRPVQEYLEKSKLEAQSAYEDLVWMKENELRARQLSRQGSGAPKAQLSGSSLLSTVGNTAQKYKVELQRFEPRGEDKVNVALDKVDFNQMMLWLGELNARYGIAVEQISVDKSDQPGQVSARLTLYI